MSYRQYDIDDFVNDPFFRSWVLKPTPDSNHFWEKWLLENAGKKKDVLTARIIIKTLQYKEENLTKDQKMALFSKITRTNEFREDIHKEEAIIRQINIPHDRKITSKTYFEKFARYAAVLSGLIVMSLAIYFYNMDNNAISEISSTMIEKANDKGQKTRIHLPDGSIVVLNSSSKLLYPASFVGEEREVFLSGEAFFEIVPDTVKPFVVKTTDLTATVLGTSFNIKAFDNHDGHSVSIVTGSVEVSTHNQNRLVLSQGEKAQIYHHSGEIERLPFNYEDDIVWKDGVLVFRKTPFREVVQRLEQWYGVDFIIDRLPDMELPVTGKFDNEYLSNILHSISFTARFRYEIKGNEVYLQF